jgi:hypothetical protein
MEKGDFFVVFGWGFGKKSLGAKVASKKSHLYKTRQSNVIYL